MYNKLMYCDNCGKQNIKFAKYCKYCGNKLIKSKKLISNNEISLNSNFEENNQNKLEKEVSRNTLEHIITRLVISSIDFFFAGFFLLITIIFLSALSPLFFNTPSQQTNTIESITTISFLSFIWIIYIYLSTLIFKGQTLGEKFLNLRIETKSNFFSKILGPLILFDYIFETTFYVKPMKMRYFSYFLCLILLTWWEYIIFLMFLSIPLISN